MNIVIGIEGYVGAGKTAICKELLNKIPNSILLDGGSLYRAIVCSLMQSGLNLDTLKQQIKAMDIKQIMEKLKVQIAIENRNTVIYVDDKKMEEEDLQSTNSSIAVSELGTIADNQNLYIFGRSLIDEFKQKFNVIVSGRDLMAIYPNLDYHFLITASLEERIRRKSIKYHEKVDLEELKQKYDAVLLTIGANVPRKMVIPGEDLEGVYCCRCYQLQNCGRFYECSIKIY